jgi:hypothetical protein
MGISAAPELPETWSEKSSNIRWRTAIPGSGNSSPIVSGGRVYLTSAVPTAGDDSQADRVGLALDFETGEILWQTPVMTAPAENRHRLNTSAGPTPATDGELVVVYFGAVLAALDLEGRIVWKTEIDPDYFEYSRYAAGSSPVLTADSVIIAQDQESVKNDDVGWLAAFDKKTGRQIWRRDWDDTCCSYSTPLIVEHEAGQRLLFAHSGSVEEYDLSSGETLWEHFFPINQMVSSIVADKDVLCVAGGAHNVKGATCVRLSGTGKDTEVEVLWETTQGAPETASPVLYDGKLFMVTSQGIVTCIDAVSGERLWRRRLAGGSYHVSLVAGDGKVYVPNAGGVTTVIALEPEIRVLAENALDRGSTASPAIAGGALLMRTRTHLVRIGKEEVARGGGSPRTAAARPRDGPRRLRDVFDGSLVAYLVGRVGAGLSQKGYPAAGQGS